MKDCRHGGLVLSPVRDSGHIVTADSSHSDCGHDKVEGMPLTLHTPEFKAHRGIDRILLTQYEQL